MFKDWKEDNFDTIEKMIRHDWERTLIPRLVPDEEQQRRIKNEIVANMDMLKEIYVYLQSHSVQYPFVDATVVKSFLIDKILVNNRNMLTNASLYNITLETCVQGERARGETN